MGRQNKTEQYKKAAIQALYENKGNVSAACSAIGIGRTQFYTWKNEDPDFAAAVDTSIDIAIDHVESKLHENIDANDTASIIFYLKTIGKKRGYVERVVHSGDPDPESVPIKHNTTHTVIFEDYTLPPDDKKK